MEVERRNRKTMKKNLIPVLIACFDREAAVSDKSAEL